MLEAKKHTPVQFYKSGQDRGDVRRADVHIEHTTGTPGVDSQTGWVATCHPRFAELIISAPRLKAVNAELLAALQAFSNAYERGELKLYDAAWRRSKAAIRAALPEDK